MKGKAPHNSIQSLMYRLASGDVTKRGMEDNIADSLVAVEEFAAVLGIPPDIAHKAHPLNRVNYKTIRKLVDQVFYKLVRTRVETLILCC